MSSRAADRSRARERGRPASGARSVAAAPARLRATEAAWLSTLPCAAITVIAVIVLGPTIGEAIPRGSVAYWSSAGGMVRPEPVEQGRVLVALCGPLLLTIVTMALARRPVALAPRTVRALVGIAQALTAAAALAGLIAQRRFVYEGVMAEGGPPFQQPYFTVPTLLVSALGTVLALVGLQRANLRARAAAVLRDSRARFLGSSLLAALATVVWLLPALNSEATMAAANFGVAYHIQFTLDETFAVLNGRTPLVDFAAQYGSLWPFPVAAAMSVLGKTIGVFTALMALISAVSMLAMYDVLRRVARSAVGGLMPFLPFLATSFFLLRGPLENSYSPANLFSDYPLRFAGPWLLAWWLTRHLAGARPRRSWPLFLIAGLVTLNNVDHGIPALGATVAAVLWADWPLTRKRARTLALELGGGLAAALALVSLLTLARTGSLPHLDLLFHYARVFAAGGFAMIPMPALGFHIAMYVTYALAIGVASARALDDHPDRVLTGLLVWTGVFGLGAGAYFAGRSHPEVLITSFGIWALAIALLLVVAVRHMADGERRRPTPLEAIGVAAFFLCACSLAQLPTPWSQVERLGASGRPFFERPVGQAFVAAQTSPGEQVAILIPLGHRIAENIGVTNVAPYTGGHSMPAASQLVETAEALRAAGGRKVFVAEFEPVGGQRGHPEIAEALQENGFVRTASVRVPRAGEIAVFTAGASGDGLRR